MLCHDAGVGIAAAGRIAEAVPLLEDAREMYGQMRCAAGLDAVRAELRALGVRQGKRGPHAQLRGWEALTGTEQRIASLIRHGLTNREIGDRLVVAPATVATHLQHIYGKLAVRSRSELSAWVVTEGH